MLGNFLNGNRETSAVSEKNQADRSGNDESRNPDVHAAEESDRPIVCAEQRVIQEGSSPSGDRMRITVSKSGGNASLAEEMFSSEGRVSVARRNPKGMRRSTGP